VAAARPAKDNHIEAQLWEAADTLRGSMDASEYKNVVLGLIFLKYVSDAFDARRAALEAMLADPESDYYFEDHERGVAAVLENRDFYLSENVFWVPAEARWVAIQDAAKLTGLGERIDGAMIAIERDNDRLKGVLPTGYANPTLDQSRLGQVVDLIGSIGFTDLEKDRDVLGRVYEYFLLKFDMAYGRAAGEFYTPRDVVQLLVEMVEPYEGRVYDPCSGSGGMFVQSADFAVAHGGSINDISVYGQEFNPTTWKLAKMNLALKGVEADLGEQWADTFARPQHADLRADFILSNPPYNIDVWHRDENDPRWAYGVPPKRNSNFAWMQHILHHLAPGGDAAIVMANGTLSSETSGEGAIRRRLFEGDVVDCVVTLPSQLFYTTGIPVCVWFFSRSRKGAKNRRKRDGEVLFINATGLGKMVSTTNREFTEEDIALITETYHAWRGSDTDELYRDQPGFCKSATLDEIEANGHVANPGRYVGVTEVEDDGVPFGTKMKVLTSALSDRFDEGAEIEARIRRNLEDVGYGL